MVLESRNVEKIMFDPRADADALFHLHGTHLRNVIDIQILYCRFRDRTNKDRFLKGLKLALQEYATLKRWDGQYREQLEATKQKGLLLFAPELGGSYQVWCNRPLSIELIEYACLDVINLHGMAEIWKAKDVLNFSKIVENRIESAINAKRAA
jgi:exonuclease 3'-5' domain-containing protein 1